ncbi:hypothetical protein CPB86DRAFT_754108 [Serendipita vermifera]|nr:hypothetical protein CPB86DRAFT_754108 [Serendipita vermifera]
MSATPFITRAVQFADISESSFGSPLSGAAPTSIDYLNAQLVAHGFTHGNGLNLDDLRGPDQRTALKCLTNMLGQRLEDMKRAEQMSAKYKTLSYDHERLLEQCRSAKEAVAQAEREMEAGKARTEAIQRKLGEEEDSHKKSKEDFHKLKLAMQYLRTTTTNEMKRKEKELEKITERWGKISNDQTRLGTIGAGLACANLLPEQPHTEGVGMWEAALADSEAARLRLLKENDAFRDVILACANALQTLHQTAVSTITKVEVEDPDLILSDELFMSNPARTQAETAHDKLRSLFKQLRDALSQAGSLGNSRRQSLKQREEDAHQIQALQLANAELKAQIQELQEASQTQGQQLLDQFVTDARFMAGRRYTADLSMELMATPNRDAMIHELDEQRKHLEQEREKITEAALNLGREKAALEAERLQFLEERRKAMVQTMLDDLPPTPEASGKVPSNLNSTQQNGAENPTSASSAALTKSSAIFPAVATSTSSKPSGRQPFGAINPPKQPNVSKRANQPPTQLVIEKNPLAMSTTPPLTDSDLSPTSPTESLSNPVKAIVKETQNTVKSTINVPPVLPPHLRTQKTPVKRSNPQSRVQHKYSPAVPSPLSRIVKMADSPPSSPESDAQRQNQRPPVIPEEDEEPEEKPVLAIGAVVVEDVPIAPEDMPAVTNTRPGSLSPLSRIMNMGLSPAIAPTLAISSFPGLLGNGRLTQDLITKPKQTLKGFGEIPGGFQLGQPIQVTSKTATTSTSSKLKVQKPKKEILGEHRSRSSKESTSSSGSDERSSATSSKKSSTGVRTATNLKVAGGTRNKENDAKKSGSATVPSRSTSLKRPVVSSAPTTNKPILKTSSVVARKPISGNLKKAVPPKGQKG